MDKLLAKLKECALLTAGKVRRTDLKKLDYSAEAITAGWEKLLKSDKYPKEFGFWHRVGPGVYQLFDVTIQAYIPLVVVQSKYLSTQSVRAFNQVFNRMVGYRQAELDARPKPRVDPMRAAECMKQAEELAATEGTTKKSAALQLFPQFGFSISQYQAVDRASRRQK